VLGENGVTTNEVTARIEKFDGGMSLDPSIKIKFTPRAERIIALACAEAKRGKRRTVEPEDLLFGILSEEAGVGMKILIDMGIDRNQILARLRC
jgi:ATP-dependent Clp protease ATP-binding subunit ClpC